MDADSRIARYYDHSTRRFLRMGGSGEALAIHRPLWPAGTSTAEAAATVTNTLVAEAAEAVLGRSPARVVDLGCGVGGTLFHLARRWPDATLAGLTLSAEQAALARQHATRRNLEARCRFHVEDFLKPAPPPRAELAIAIESAVHAPSVDAFAHAAAGRLAAGGILVVVEDTLAVAEDALSPSQARWVAQVRQGWHLGHVPTAEALNAAARAAALEPVAAQDLTPFLRLDRLRDRMLRPIGPVAAWLGLVSVPLFANMIGGNALTCAYRAGIMRYRLLTFRKAAP